jgi:hypothetical protein
MKQIGSILLKGLVTILPIGLTIYFVYWLGVTTEGLLSKPIRLVLPYTVGGSADAFIPDFMREVVLGAYIEGFLTTSGGTQSTGTGGVGGGVTLELQFPYDLVLSGTYVPPASAGADLVWEP